MKRFVMAVALTCSLYASSLAGEIPSGGIAAPPPPYQAQTTTTAPGEIPSTDLRQQVSEAALTLVQFLLGAVV